MHPALDQPSLAPPAGGVAQPALSLRGENVTRESAFGRCDSHSGMLPQSRTLRPVVKQYEIGIRQCCRQGWTFGCENHGITEQGDLYLLGKQRGSNPNPDPDQGAQANRRGLILKCRRMACSGTRATARCGALVSPDATPSSTGGVFLHPWSHSWQTAYHQPGRGGQYLRLRFSGRVAGSAGGPGGITHSQ